MKIIYLTILIFTLLIALGVYLNRSYAYIYREIRSVNLSSPDTQRVYTVGSAGTAPISYAVLGDSLTAGVGVNDFRQSYSYLVAEKVVTSGRAVALRNFSVSGATTSELIKYQLSEVVTDKPNVIILLIGINDIHSNVSKVAFKKKYGKILEQLSQNTDATVYAVSIPYLGARTLFLPPYQAYFNYKTKEFNNSIKELAVVYKANYIDLYTPTVQLFMKSGPHYSADAFHPSADGYKTWAEILYDSLNQ